MDRKDAVDTLRALVDAKCIIQPSLLSLQQDDEQKYCILVKETVEFDLLRAFLADKHLILFIDKQNGYCKIYKP